MELPTTTPPKRRLRNYLIDPRFQLKYTGAVVLVALLVGGVLGTIAYRYSSQQTEALKVAKAVDPTIDERTWARIEGEAEAEDRRVLGFIVGGIAILAVVLGFTGIYVTHKVVGPAYKMRKLLKDVARGKLRFDGRLRKGDELQDLFRAFETMIQALREFQTEEVAHLDAAIERAREAGTPEDALASVVEVRQRMQAALD